MSIFEELIERVDNGETFHINFKTRTMKVGKSYLVKNGEYDTSRILFIDNIHRSMDDVLNMIDIKYKTYKYSLPSERSESKRKGYFKALSFSELTDEQLFIADKREVARAQLEGFILCMLLNGSFVWNEETMGKWFYQSKCDPDLIILKDWII